MKNKREFYVETPLGLLRVSAKGTDGTGEEADYPGVDVELVKNKNERWGELIATIEYSPWNKRVQTVAYNKSSDEPVTIVDHTNEKIIL